MSTVTTGSQIFGHDDDPRSKNPQRVNVNWKHEIKALKDVTIQGRQVTSVPALATATIFDSTIALTTDASTGFTLAPGLYGRYRLAWNSAGAAPGFRTARTVPVATGNLTLTLNVDNTLTVISSLGAVFGAAVTSDEVWIPGASTGDTGPFSSLNEGRWSVLQATSSVLTLMRPQGAVFTGTGETVAVTSASQFQVFSASGVQSGDAVDISAGFSAASQHAYQVSAVTATSLEFSSLSPLPQETAVPGIAGLQVYREARKYLWVDTTQEVALRLNGATTDTTRLEPVVPGDLDGRGRFEIFGTAWKLVVKNRSTSPAEIGWMSWR